MRLSELANKRILNLADGELLGYAGDGDLIFDPGSGELLCLAVPRTHGSRLRRREAKEELRIPWSAIRKVGSEVIVVELEEE